jgi:hypothetical protein
MLDSPRTQGKHYRKSVESHFHSAGYFDRISIKERVHEYEYYHPP